MPDNATVTVRSPFDSISASREFDSFQSEYAAIPRDKFSAMNFDAVNGAMIAAVAMMRVAPLREEIQSHAPRFPIELIEKVPRLAAAVWWAFQSSHAANLTPADYEALFEKAKHYRAKMLIAATQLVFDNRLPGPAVAEIEQGSGAMDTLSDVGKCVDLFTQYWSRVEGFSIVTRDDVVQAKEIGERLFFAQALKVHGSAPTEISTEMKQRAVTALDLAYEQVRQVVQFIRPETYQSITPTMREQGPRRAPEKDGDVAPGKAAPPKNDVAPAAPPPSTGKPIGDGSDPFKK